MKPLDFLDQRLGLTSRHRRLMDRPVPARLSYLFCLGGVTFTLFVASGADRAAAVAFIIYLPNADAYLSIQRLHTSVPLGGILRSVHHWAANLMVVMVVLHMLRVFVNGAYKTPRELNWIAGVLLFLLHAGFRFHRLPAALGPEGLLGHRGRYQHARIGPVHGSLACGARPRAVQRWRPDACCAFTASTSSGSRF